MADFDQGETRNEYFRSLSLSWNLGYYACSVKHDVIHKTGSTYHSAVGGGPSHGHMQNA